MANSFLKQVTIGWNKFVDNFEDQLVMSKIIGREDVDPREMERSMNVVWRPRKQIMRTVSGSDQSKEFKPKAQLAIPLVIDRRESVTFSMTDEELLDEIQQENMGDGAWQALASIVNVACLQCASTFGTMVIKKTSAASEYQDLANIRTMMSRNGIPYQDRKFAMNSTDYNGIARDLANRADVSARLSTNAYTEALVTRSAGIELFELDYGVAQAAALGGGGLTMSTLAGVNDYAPVSTVEGASGLSPVDNRFQTITGTAAWTGVKKGDAFTISGINEVHPITHVDTGFLKTFRVALTPAAGSTSLVISPPIISNQLVNGLITSEAANQYQNCVVNTPSATSAIVFLNTVAVQTNPFWAKNAIVLTPGHMAPPKDSGAMIMSATTENGIEITMWRQVDIKTGLCLYRYDVRFGVNAMNPEQMGIALYNQS